MSPSSSTNHADFWRFLSHASSLAKGGNLTACCQILDRLEQDLNVGDIPHKHKRLEMLRKFRETFPGTQFPPKVDSKVANATHIPIDELVKKVKIGVSLVTCCMNRNENLIKALPSWIAHDQIDEILIVDWSSETPVREDLDARGFSDKRIRVARVHGQQRWILSYAYNVGFRLARFDKILKVDSDIILQEHFFKKNILREHSFISGDWRIADKGQEYINGFFYVRRDDLLQIKGFNEHITTYGWDDDDLYCRLEQLGLTRTLVDARTVYHLPHTDDQRLGAPAGESRCARDQLLSTPLQKIRQNRYLAFVMPEWNKDRILLPCTVKQISDNHLLVEQSGDSVHVVPDHIRSYAEYHGLLELTWWRFGSRALALPPEQLNELLSKRCLENISRLDIDLLCSSEHPAICWKHNSLILQVDSVDLQRLRDSLGLFDQLAQLLDCTIWLAGVGIDIRSELAPQGHSDVMQLPREIDGRAFPHLGLESLREVLASFAQQHVFWTNVTPPILEQISAFVQSARPALPQQLVYAFTRASKPKFYIDVQHGLGNRLRAFASACAIAEKSDRELILVWIPDHHCQCPFLDIFEYDGTVISEPLNLPDKRVDFYSYMEIEEGSQKNALINIDTDNDIYVRSAFVLNNPNSDWDSENRILRRLKPRQIVEDLVASVNVSGFIGAHVRMEAGRGLDHNSYDSRNNWHLESHEQLHYWRAQSHFSRFISRIDALLFEQPDLRLFLAADMPETYRIFHDRYGKRLSYLNRDTYDRSRKQIIYGLADAILLSKCQRLLGSTWSSFSELAMRLSTSFSSIEMSGKDF